MSSGRDRACFATVSDDAGGVVDIDLNNLGQTRTPLRTPGGGVRRRTRSNRDATPRARPPRRGPPAHARTARIPLSRAVLQSQDDHRAGRLASRGPGSCGAAGAATAAAPFPRCHRRPALRPRAAASEPARVRQGGAGAARADRRSRPTSPSVATSTRPSCAIASRLERCMTLGRSGHGVSTTARTSSPAARADSTVSSVWLMVPRPGPRGDDDRPVEVDRQVAHGVAQRERDEQPADALGDHDVGRAARARGPRAPPGRAPCRPARPPGAARRRARSDAARPRPTGRPAAGGEQLVVGAGGRPRARRGR